MTTPGTQQATYALDRGRPPGAREGSALAYNGRPLVAGVGSYLHSISPRASIADLWSTMEIVAAAGASALQASGGPKLDQAGRRRLAAYINQARQYFEASRAADPVAKPLLGYYFALNITKAFLTAAQPTLTESPGIAHGIGQDTSGLTGQYAFGQERLLVKSAGVFQELARLTGRGFIWSAGSMQLLRLIPYLSESVDLFASSSGMKPALIPISRVFISGSGQRPQKLAWISVEISRLALEEVRSGPRKLLEEAAAFASSFDLVDDGNQATATYQLRTPITYAAMPGPLSGLRTAFDRSMIVRNRAATVRRDFITKSPHVNLISNEALTFAVMLHLSNMVRYRPHLSIRSSEHHRYCG